MKLYLLSLYQPGGAPGPEVLEPIMRDLAVVEEEMRAAGAWVFSGGLRDPSTATVVRATDDDWIVTDGPYAESKEFLGGFTIVRAPGLEAALAWGRKLARASTLPVEVRPFAG